MPAVFLVALAGVALALGAALTLLLVRRPWLAPWFVVPLFATSAELQLRITGSVGILKDVVVLLLVVATAIHVLRSRELLERLRPWRAPLGALGVVLGLYVLNPVGEHGLDWAVSLRLLLEATALLLVALLTPDPGRTREHLVRAVAVMAAFEAVFAWVQQAVGEDTLVYSWGYQFGAQVRQTSSGGLRTPGTFAEPFALTAFAILALCLGLFVARRWSAAVLIVSAVAVLGATSVRTSYVQVLVIGLVYALYRGWRTQAAVVGAAVAAIGVLAGSVITTAPYPGGPQTPLILGLNGRSTVWQLAIQGPVSLLTGNGVAMVGAGSDRSAQGLIGQAASYNAITNPTAATVDPSTFLDSAYAQVQSDAGIIGTVALLIWLVGTLVVLGRRPALHTRLARARARRPGRPDRVPGGPRALAFGAIAVLLAGAVDWVGRTTLFAFPTGFLLLFVFGLLCAEPVTRPVTERYGAPVRWGREPSPRSARRAMAERADAPAADGAPDVSEGSSQEAPAEVPAEAPARSGARLARLGVLAAVISRLFGRLVGVLFVVVLARTSSDETVAVYGYLLGTATLVVTLTDLGVAAVAGRDVAARRFSAQAALAAALPAQAVAILGACLVTLGLVFFSAPAGVTAAPLLLTLAFLALNGMVNLWAELLRGQGRVVVEAALQILSAALLVVVGLIVVERGGGATALLAVVAGKEIVILALGWMLLRPHREPEAVRTRQLIRHSIFVALAGTAVILLWRQGTLFVGATGSVTGLAVYVVASRFLDAGVTVANTVGFGLLPGASSAVDDPPAFRAIALRYLTLVGVVGGVAALVGNAFAGPITTGLFGERWVDAIPAVRAIAVGALPILVGYVAWFLLLACHQQRWIAGGAGLGAVTAIAATLVSSGSVSDPTAAAFGTTVGACVMAGILVLRLVVVLTRLQPPPLEPSERSAVLVP